MEMQDRHAAILGELSELSLSLARDLHQAALEAEEPAQKAELASAFHKLSRSVRQTLALEAKLRRDMQADAQRVQARVRDAERQQQQKRKDAIQEEVSRLIWTESERSDHDNDELEEDLEALLIFNDLPDLPDPEIIRQLAERLGLPKSSPPGEGDREAVEGVEGQGVRHPAPQPPQSAGESSPGREHLTPHPTVMAGPVPAIHAAAAPGQDIAHRHMDHPDTPGDDGRAEYWPPPDPIPIGLPGEFGPNGETGEDRILPPI